MTSDLRVIRDRLIAAFRNHIRLILTTTALGLLLAYAFLELSPPKYKTAAQLLFDPSAEQIAKSEPGALSGIFNLKALERTIALIKSPATLKQVAVKLNADAKLRSFMPATALQAIITRSNVSDDIKIRQLMVQLDRDIGVKTEASDQIIIIEYQSKSPEEAAYIANLVVQSFIESREQAHKASASVAAKWLDDRFVEAKGKLLEVDRKIQTFKATHKIDDENRVSIDDDRQLQSLRRELSELQTKLSQAEAVYQTLQSETADPTNYSRRAQALDDPTLDKLQFSLIEVEKEVAAVKARLGNSHPDVRAKESQAQLLKAEIERVSKRRVSEVADNAARLRNRRKELENSIDDVERKLRAIRVSEVELRELLREKAAIKTLYDSTLSKLMAAPQQTLAIEEFKSLLDAPIPDKPKIPPILIWLLGGVFGIGSGLALGLLLELLNDKIIHIDQAEAHLPIKVLARVPAISGQEHIKAGDRVGYNSRFAATHADSLFTSCLMAAKLAASEGTGGQEHKLVMIASSMPGEGKTLVASNLASLSGLAGERTLLINFDARKTSRSFHGPSAAEPYLPLLEFLETSQLDEVFTIAWETEKLHVLNLASTGGTAWSKLLQPQMRELLAFCRAHYDRIWIDTPPLQLFSDALIFANQVDGIVLVAQWGKTTMSQIEKSLDIVSKKNGNVLGIIINKTDIKQAIYNNWNAYKQYYGEMGAA